MSRETAERILSFIVAFMVCVLIILGCALWVDLALIKTGYITLPTSEEMQVKIADFLDFLPKAFAVAVLILSPFFVYEAGTAGINWYYGKRKNDEAINSESES